MITTFALKCHTYFPVVSSTVQSLRESMPSLPHSLHDQEVLILHTVICLSNDRVLSRRRDAQLYLTKTTWHSKSIDDIRLKF